MDASRLTPRKVEALEAMSRAPLEFQQGVGWSNEFTADPFNTHSIVWMSWNGLCVVYDDRRAVITRAGRQALDLVEVAA